MPIMMNFATRSMLLFCALFFIAIGSCARVRELDLRPNISIKNMLTYVLHLTRESTSSDKWVISSSVTDTLIGQYSRWSRENLKCDSLSVWAICPYDSAWTRPLVPGLKLIKDSSVLSRARRLYCVYDATDFDYSEFEFLTTWEFTTQDSIRLIGAQSLATKHWHTSVPMRCTLFPDGSVLLLLFRYGSGGDKFVTPIEKVQFLRSLDGQRFETFYERLSEPYNTHAYAYQFDVTWLMQPFYSVAEFGEYMTLEPEQSRFNGLRSLDSTSSRVLNLWDLAKKTLSIDTTSLVPFYDRGD